MLFPVQKKFTKQTRSHFPHNSKKQKGTKHHFSFRVLWITFGVILLCYSFFLLLKYTLFVPEYIISKVDYALANVQDYDDPYFYKSVSTLLKGENYRLVELNHSSVLSQIQAKYPFVSDYSLTYKGPNKVFFKAYFNEPKLIVFNGNLRYAVYGNSFFQFFSGNRLWSGALRVELFPVSSGMTFTGLFYKKSFDSFISDMNTIQSSFPTAKYFVYLVGGQRIIVWLPKDREVYINLLVDVLLQVQNYQYLKQYYTDFTKLKVVDLWSIEIDKVIVRK